MATACDIVWKALVQFKASVSQEDACIFQDTTHEDLRDGILQIEKELGRRWDLRFMRRIEPFLESMANYGPVIEVFSQGYSLMAFVWVSCALDVLRGPYLPGRVLGPDQAYATRTSFLITTNDMPNE